MKKNKKWHSIMVILLLLGTGICVAQRSEVRRMTEQKKQILEKEGVPADYDQLTDRQKRFLKRADKMMSYLNDKYGKYGVSFLYDGYHPAEMFDGEWLVAYPEGGDPELDRVSVDRVKGNQDIFKDDYLNVATRPYWKEILDDYLSQWFDPEDYRIYVTDAELEKMEVGDLPDLSKEFLENAGAISGTAYIYISEKACTLEKFEEFADAYHVWLLENQYYGSQDEYLYTQEGIEQLTGYNFADDREKYTVADAYGYIHQNKIIDGFEIKNMGEENE